MQSGFSDTDIRLLVAINNTSRSLGRLNELLSSKDRDYSSIQDAICMYVSHILLVESYKDRYPTLEPIVNLLWIQLDGTCLSNMNFTL